MTQSRASQVLDHATDMCLGKACFVTRREAMTLLKRNGFRGKPYQCQLCGFWHITSKNKGHSNRARRRISTAKRTLAAA